MEQPAHGALVDSGDQPALTSTDEPPLVPDYGGACLSEVVPTLLGRDAVREAGGSLPAWVPEPLLDAEQLVLLVLDGLGYEQLLANGDHAPALMAMAGGSITSVAPTTTATALTSLTTGRRPSEHGILGYRMRERDEILNVLRWTLDGRDASDVLPPARFQPFPPFAGRDVPVVSRAEFAGTGFTGAHLDRARLSGWRMPSMLRVEVDRLVRSGERFVYAYYDGIDKVAHDRGLGAHFVAELGTADRMVSDLLADLPVGCALAVTADHGQVEVPGAPIVLAAEILEDVALLSGEGRFRWLHVVPGARERVLDRCRERYGEVAWVHSRDEIVAAGWFGGPLEPELAARLGDVALVARAPVAFHDPNDTGELALVSRHGSLTRAEMVVPFLAWAP